MTDTPPPSNQPGRLVFGKTRLSRCRWCFQLLQERVTNLGSYAVCPRCDSTPAEWPGMSSRFVG